MVMTVIVAVIMTAAFVMAMAAVIMMVMAVVIIMVMAVVVAVVVLVSMIVAVMTVCMARFLLILRTIIVTAVLVVVFMVVMTVVAVLMFGVLGILCLLLQFQCSSSPTSSCDSRSVLPFGVQLSNQALGIWAKHLLDVHTTVLTCVHLWICYRGQFWTIWMVAVLLLKARNEQNHVSSLILYPS